MVHRRRLRRIRAVVICVSLAFLGGALVARNSNTAPSRRLGGDNGAVAQPDVEVDKRVMSIIKSTLGVRSRSPRPIMHTFFHPVPNEISGTQMSDKANDDLIAAWKEAWRNAGYDPVVLGLDDAKRHPLYDSYVQKLQTVPMMGKGGKGLNILYNQLCFLRWLAMAAAGGGFMCDYDVFPLEPHQPQDEVRQGYGDPTSLLPYGGQFTGYESGIPSYMSGTADEWTRMAGTVLANALLRTDETLVSDMLALQQVRGAFRRERDVVDGKNVLIGRDFTAEDCKTITKGKRAVHFSHDAIYNGKLKEGEKVEDRPKIAKEFIEKWKKLCQDGVDVVVNY